MSLDPIRFFSLCQARFYEKTSLDMKIYSLTSSILIGGISYLASLYKAFPLKQIEPMKVGIGMTITAWLIYSTVGGYLSYTT